jgi:hypothetical protein
VTSSSTQVLSIKRKVLAAVATLAVVGGVSAAAAGSASAVTPVCGPTCIYVFSSELGSYGDPNFVEAVLGGGAARVGQPVGLKQASGSDPSEDIKPLGGQVSDFYAAEMVSAEANSHYGSLMAVQQEYAPAEDMDAGAQAFSTMDPAETPGTRASVDMCEIKLELDVSGR